MSNAVQNQTETKSYASVPFSVTKATEENDENYVVEGFASTFHNVDLQGDIIEPGAFTDSIERLKANVLKNNGGPLVPALFNHNMDRVVGGFRELRETDLGLESKAFLPKSSTFVSGELMPQVRARNIGGMSIGFYIDDRRWEGEIRHISKVSLIEISFTPFPANPAARIVDAKTLLTSDDLEDMSDEELERLVKSGVRLSKRLAGQVVHSLKAMRRKAVELENGRKAREIEEQAKQLARAQARDQFLSALNNLSTG
jgi:HK97 family phage prohead protease